MQERQPDFSLASSESVALFTPRACWCQRWGPAENQAEFLRIKIDPPIPAGTPGFLYADVSELVLTPRHVGESLSAPSCWPVAVHVLVPMHIDGEEKLHHAAWAELYPALSQQNAERKA